MLGLVTSKAPEPESTNAPCVASTGPRPPPRDNLCLSPQCGFSSTHHGNALTEADQWAKLARVVEVAQSIRR